MKRRFITAISLLFLASYAVLSYFQFHYFEIERLRLIDQQLDRTTSVLASSHLSRDILSSQQKTEEVIFDTLDEEPPNQVLFLRRPDGTILYRNSTAEDLDLILPFTDARTSLEIDGHQLRYVTYRLPNHPLVIQVGLILDQREISWRHAIWRMVGFSAVVTIIFILLATWLTGYLLRPIVELARYFKHHAVETSGEFPVPAFVNDTQEFRILSDTIRDANMRWRDSLMHHSSLMARLVHEIRTPLTILRNRLEGILKNAPEAKAAEVIAELEHIETLTGDFAHWSKIEYSMPSDPALHAIAIVSFVQELACVKEGPARLRLDLRAPASTKIFAKPEHLRLLLENLLNNADKHGDASQPITLVVEAEQFSVRSFGAAVPEGVIKKLGRPFNRGSESVGGSGLGLANVISICKKYGWAMDYARDGEENVFRVSF